MLYHERWEQELVYRRAEDPPRPAAGDQAGAPAERDAGGGDPGDLRAVAGPFRDPGADVRGGGDGGAGPGSVVVPGCFQILKCRLPECDSSTPGDSRSGIGGCCGRCSKSGPTTRCAEPDQSPGDQAKDVEIEEETTRASTCSAVEENLCGDSGYASLNGIGVRRAGDRRRRRCSSSRSETP